MYSSLGFEIVSILISYFWPSPGVIFLKCFQGLPLGRFIKNLTFSIQASLGNLDLSIFIKGWNHFEYFFGQDFYTVSR